MTRIFSIPAALVSLTLGTAGAASACGEVTASSNGQNSLAVVMSFGCTLVSIDQVGSFNELFATINNGTAVTGTYGHGNRQQLNATSGGTIVAQTLANNTSLIADAHKGGTVDVYQGADGSRVRATATGGSYVRVATR